MGADNVELVVPTSLGEALQRLRQGTDVRVVAGGTWFMREDAALTAAAERPVTILALHELRELRRVVRTGNHVEIGAGLPGGRLIADRARRVLPRMLIHAIRGLGPPPVRNLATLGGGIAIPDTILPLRAMLELIDASVELRRQGNSRWVKLGAMNRQPDELITRIRLPSRNWTHWINHTWGTPFPAGLSSLTLVGAASLDKTGIDEFRFAMIIDGQVLIRLRQSETDLVGRTVPLTERDRRTIIAGLEEHPAFGRELDDLGRWRASNGLRRFLMQLE